MTYPLRAFNLSTDIILTVYSISIYKARKQRDSVDLSFEMYEHFRHEY